MHALNRILKFFETYYNNIFLNYLYQQQNKIILLIVQLYNYFAKNILWDVSQNFHKIFRITLTPTLIFIIQYKP